MLRRPCFLPVAVVALLGCNDVTGSRDSTPVVTVDFAAAGAPVRSMVGLLHAFDATSPADSLIAPLRPALWRASYATVDRAAVARARRLGATPILLLSDFWWYPAGSCCNRSAPPPPYQDPKGWEDSVRSMARNTRGQGFIHDVWNEPDLPLYWGGTREQYLDTFRRAEKVLRAELGSEAVVAGPSLSEWDTAGMREFLDYCVRHGIRVDVLTWHEFQLDGNLGRMVDNLRRARAMINEPKYRLVGVRKIQIQEEGPWVSQFRPGSALATLWYLERGGADGAARSCWNDDESGPVINCWNNTLDGLLTPEGEPRAVWWAYRAYAGTLDARVPSSVSDDRLVSFAARESASGPAQVVVGYYGLREESIEALSPRLRFRNLHRLGPAGTTRVRVVVRRIPATGKVAQAQLPVVLEGVLDVSSGDATMDIPPLQMYEGYIVTLSPEPPKS